MLAIAVGCALCIATATDVGQAQSITTPPQPFTVSAQVYAGCSFSAPNFSFTNYAIGQLSPSYGQVNWTVNCPGAGAGAPPRTLPVRFTMSTTQGEFRMRSGGFGLFYQLCNDAACAQPYAQSLAGPSISVNANPFTYTLYGEIFGGQAAPRGTYTQVVRVFLTY